MAKPPSKRILVVGHCGIDGPRLVRVLSEQFRGSSVERINSSEDLDAALASRADLLLVNREPVGFESTGLQIVRDVCAAHPGATVMLISDYPDAQEEAQRVGAVPGIGKSKIDSPEFGRVVGAALGADA
ncbi:MAG: hypothetical protein ACAI43_02590 [Phycisphaerae bacterium]|nr:hypothetical protein [Tepidisphaeraceae bacterium]